jgi:hypothetical protein
MIRRALTSILGLTVVLAAILLVPAAATAHPWHDHSGRASGHIHAAAKVTHADAGPAGSAQAATCAGASVAEASFAKDWVVAAPFIAALATLATAEPRTTLDSLATPSTDPGLRGAIALMAGACTGSGCTGPSCCPGGACSACGGLTAEAETDPRPPLAATRPVSTPEAIRPGTASSGLERPPRSFS